MSRPPPLTEIQKERLAELEPRLKRAAKAGEVELAADLTRQIQLLLRPTGHETRLMQSKLWYFEAVLESGSLNRARDGLVGVRRKVNRRTRLYLEATVLLAISYLRQKDLGSAQEFIDEVMNLETVIQNPQRRSAFYRAAVERFDEEALLAALRGICDEHLDPAELQNQAGTLLQTRTEDEIFIDLANTLPPEAVNFYLEVDRAAKRQLPRHELKLLPPPRQVSENLTIGRRLLAAINRVLWPALCDSSSTLYQAWIGEGLDFVLDRRYLAAAIAAALGSLGIGLKLLAASAIALILKTGLPTFCEHFRPVGLMEGRSA